MRLFVPNGVLRYTYDKSILYYTCLSHSEDIELACRKQLLAASGGLPIISVSLNQPIDFGENIVLHGERGPVMMHEQILVGLDAISADYVFFAENDVLYHPSHFIFTPPRADTFYYNSNVWRVRYGDGHAVWTDDLQQTSGLCASRALLYDFYRFRVAQIHFEGCNRHYEPGSKQTVGGQLTANWMSAFPNIDIRHDKTLTRSKWSPSAFRNQRYAKGWKETDEIEGWGKTAEIVKAIKEQR